VSGWSGSRTKGAMGVYWHTQAFKAHALALYDTLAQRTSSILYQS
jgi:hypothetical protein